MQGEIIHRVNGVQVEDPVGWGDFEEELDRDYDRRIISSKYPAEVTFVGDGCALLRALYDDGLCNDVPYTADLECDGVTDRVIQGIIILSDIEWLFRSDCPMEAKVSVADDGVGARIINNIRVKVFPTADVTKNGEAITPATIRDIEFFTNLNVSVGTSQGFDWLECMEHCVGYITDNAVGVVSDWYAALPNDQRYVLVNGHELRVPTGTPTAPEPPSYSFDQLWGNMWRKYNLMAGVVRVSDEPFLRIEPEAYWYGSGIVTGFEHQDNLVEKIDTDRLYASVEVGSQDYIKDQDAAYPYPAGLYASFVKEEFTIAGQCNTDQRLDLVSTFVIDTNVIYDVIQNNVEDYDEDVFMVQYIEATNDAKMVQYLEPGVGPWLYNEELLNSHVIPRFSFAGDLIVNVSIQNNAVVATHYATQLFYSNLSPSFGVTYTSATTQAQFSNDYTPPNLDPSNNWGNGTAPGTPVSQVNSRYTAQIAGAYQFVEQFTWQAYRKFSTVTGTVSETIMDTMRMSRFDIANNLISTQDEVFSHPYFLDTGFSQTNFDISQNFAEIGIFNVTMNVGDYVIIENFYTYLNVASEPLVYDEFQFKVLDVARISTSLLPTSGGTITMDGDLYRSTLYEFDRFVPLSEWVSLRGDPTQRVDVSPGTEMISAHMYNAKRNIRTGACKWLLLTNRASQ